MSAKLGTAQDTSSSLVPADIAWHHGSPFARRYDDIYFSVDGLNEAERTLIAPTDLIGLSNAHAHLCVAELGFGTGLNFAAIADTVLAHSKASLHFIAFEAHPLSLVDWQKMAVLHSARLPMYDLLVQQPLPILAGWHRRTFAGGRVVLSVFHGSAISGLTDLVKRQRNTVDVWILDGFAPAKNPDMWTPDLFQQIANTAYPGTQLATFCAATAVFHNLQAVGFELRRIDQRPHKQESLAGTFIPHRRRRQAPRATTVTVHGAGIGGATMARHLAEQGVNVGVFDPHGIATGGSCIRSALLHARLLGDRSVTAEHRAAAFHYATNYLRNYPGVAHSGVLQVAGPNFSAQKLARVADAYDVAAKHHHYWMQRLNCDETARCARLPLRNESLWFPSAKTIDLPRLCMALLSHANIEFHARAADPNDSEPNILCAGTASRFLPTPGPQNFAWMEIADVEGQLDDVRISSAMPNVPIVGNGYVVPHATGLTIGATYEYKPWTHEAASAHNIELNSNYLGPCLTPVSRIRATRAVSSDRVPLVGQLGENIWVASAHGSMGTSSAPFAAAVVASELLGWIPPASPAVVALLNPLRFLARQARRGVRHIGA
jgi:tRNA 5-methylaminomethyl-2-thiouridine biosynthesis bifunctional protein